MLAGVGWVGVGLVEAGAPAAWRWISVVGNSHMPARRPVSGRRVRRVEWVAGAGGVGGVGGGWVGAAGVAVDVGEDAAARTITAVT